jgi:hypothetical protein
VQKKIFEYKREETTGSSGKLHEKLPKLVYLSTHTAITFLRWDVIFYLCRIAALKKEYGAFMKTTLNLDN